MIGWADRFKICKIIRRFNLLSSTVSAGGGSASQGLKAGMSTVASSIASTVLSSGAGFAGSFVTTSNDKKEMGTHVEISLSNFFQFNFFSNNLTNLFNIFQ